MLRRSTELARQATLTPRVIGDDAHDQLDLLADGRALVNLGNIVERRLSNTTADRVDDVSSPLARIGVDDIGSGHVLGKRARDLLNESDFAPRSTVEGAPQAHQCPDNGGIGIALDGIVGHHTREGRPPARELGGDDAQIDDVEWIFNGALHAGLECRVVVLPRLVRRRVWLAADERQGLRCTLVQMISRSETEALANGRAAHVGVAFAQRGG